MRIKSEFVYALAPSWKSRSRQIKLCKQEVSKKLVSHLQTYHTNVRKHQAEQISSVWRIYGKLTEQRYHQEDCVSQFNGTTCMRFHIPFYNNIGIYYIRPDIQGEIVGKGGRWVRKAKITSSKSVYCKNKCHHRNHRRISIPNIYTGLKFQFRLKLRL